MLPDPSVQGSRRPPHTSTDGRHHHHRPTHPDWSLGPSSRVHGCQHLTRPARGLGTYRESPVPDRNSVDHHERPRLTPSVPTPIGVRWLPFVPPRPPHRRHDVGTITPVVSTKVYHRRYPSTPFTQNEWRTRTSSDVTTGYVRHLNRNHEDFYTSVVRRTPFTPVTVTEDGVGTTLSIPTVYTTPRSLHLYVPDNPGSRPT